MGIWKIAIALLIGTALTESGRKSLRNMAKELIKTSQSTKDKVTVALEDLKVQAKELIEEAKTSPKDGSGNKEKRG